MSAYMDQVKALHDRYLAGIATIAVAAFEEHVVPFCDRNGLWLVQLQNALEGDKVFGQPGGGFDSTDWNDYLDCFEIRKARPEYKPPEGYAELRNLVDIALPHDADLTLLWFMPEYKPERKLKL